MITINADVDGLIARIKAKKDKVFTRDIVEELALQAKNAILLNTGMAKDKNRAQFASYSYLYAQKKGLGINQVNLIQSGLMLNSMTQKALDNKTAMIFFTNSTASERAGWHIDGAGNLPKRDFFGVSDVDVQKLVAQYKKFVNQVLNG